MEKKSLVIINNEKVFDEDGQFYCSNYDMMATPEALNNYYSVQFIARKSKKKGGHKFDLKNIKIGSNIFGFMRHIYKTFKMPNTKYLLIKCLGFCYLNWLLLTLLFYFLKILLLQIQIIN